MVDDCVNLCPLSLLGILLEYYMVDVLIGISILHLTAGAGAALVLLVVSLRKTRSEDVSGLSSDIYLRFFAPPICTFLKGGDFLSLMHSSSGYWGGVSNGGLGWASPWSYVGQYPEGEFIFSMNAS